MLLLLAVGIVRLAIPDRSRLRPLSIEACWIDSDTIDPSNTLTREQTWNPPDDVYVVGWNPWLGIPSSAKFEAELMLYNPAPRPPSSS